MKAMILHRPGAHEFAAISLKVAGVLDGLGIGSDVMPIEAFADGLPRHVDLLVINLGAPAPEESTGTPAGSATSWQTRALTRILEHTRSGRPCLILHIAITAFEFDARWRALVGGAWSKGVSFHEPLGPVTIAPADDPIVGGAARFPIVDEIYEQLSLEPGVRVLATAPERRDAPVLWVQDRDGGRTAYCALGHTPRSYDSDGLRTLISRTILWLMTSGTITPGEVRSPR